MMDEAGVDRAIIVPPSWEGDRNDYALDAAGARPDRFRVMGRIALKDKRAPHLLAAWKQQPGMLGVRLTFLRAQASRVRDDYRQRIAHLTDELTFLTDVDRNCIMGRSILARLGLSVDPD
jgi:predicted TIM-barrel fold metal-dependent hydrolase